MLSVMTYNIPMNKEIKKLAMAAIFLALGLLLPFVTGQIPQIGSMLLPMHIPVFLCAIIVDYKYGALIGFITPLLRSFLFSMPPMFPTAFAMAFELMTYGLVMGMLWQFSKHKCVFAIYRSLVASMLMGRVVWGLVMVILSATSNVSFGLTAFITSGFTSAIPGIILQLILIPVIIYALGKMRYIEFDTKEVKAQS